MQYYPLDSVTSSWNPIMQNFQEHFKDSSRNSKKKFWRNFNETFRNLWQIKKKNSAKFRTVGVNFRKKDNFWSENYEEILKTILLEFSESSKLIF